MASINSLGGGPERSADLTIIMNFIVTSPFPFVCFRVWEPRIRRGGRRLNSGSIGTSNEKQGNRHVTRISSAARAGSRNFQTPGESQSSRSRGGDTGWPTRLPHPLL